MYVQYICIVRNTLLELNSFLYIIIIITKQNNANSGANINCNINCLVYMSNDLYAVDAYIPVNIIMSDIWCLCVFPITYASVLQLHTQQCF